MNQLFHDDERFLTNTVRVEWVYVDSPTVKVWKKSQNLPASAVPTFVVPTISRDAGSG